MKHEIISLWLRDYYTRLNMTHDTNGIPGVGRIFHFSNLTFSFGPILRLVASFQDVEFSALISYPRLPYVHWFRIGPIITWALVNMDLHSEKARSKWVGFGAFDFFFISQSSSREKEIILDVVVRLQRTPPRNQKLFWAKGQGIIWQSFSFAVKLTHILGLSVL